MAVGESNYKMDYSNSWALIIGIDNYQILNPLQHATNDAEELADVLEKKFSFPESNISLLLDEDATKEEIEKEYNNFTNEEKIGPNDRLLVFFAGHGHTIQGKRGDVGFLVPVDGKTDDINSLVRWDKLTRGADLIPAKHVFFIMDACYGGLALQRSPPPGSMRFIGDMLQRYSRQALTAGKPDEPVSDGKGIHSDHSIFTSYLLEGLKGEAGEEDKVITANRLMSYVYNKVACDTYSNQTPHYGFVQGDGDFIFNLSELDVDLEDETGSKKSDKDILIKTSPPINHINKNQSVTEIMKDLLADPKKKINLEDFVVSHIRKFQNATDLEYFPVEQSNVQKLYPGKVSDEIFIERVEKYEEITNDLIKIVILLAKWADEDQIYLLKKILKRMSETTEKSSGIRLWLRLRWYPIQLIMYSAGISALSAKNFKVLKPIFETKVPDKIGSNNGSPITISAGKKLTEINDSFKQIPGHERNYAPRSERLFKILQPTLEDLLFLGKSYDEFFDKFEVLFALEYAHITGDDWGPIGRYGWKHNSIQYQSPLELIIDEADKKGEDWGPIEAGLFDGSFDDFQESAESINQLLDDLSWH